MKKILAALVLFGMMVLLVIACTAQGGSCTSSRCTSVGPEGTVHLGLTNFDQSTVTFAKGGTLTLIDDSAAVHNINNGSWINGAAQPNQESGAPQVSNLQLSQAGQSKVIGPFNTAGTFHLYCSIHTNMNLTIIVQ